MTRFGDLIIRSASRGNALDLLVMPASLWGVLAPVDRHFSIELVERVAGKLRVPGDFFVRKRIYLPAGLLDDSASDVVFE
jgi:hypothetical protein